MKSILVLSVGLLSSFVYGKSSFFDDGIKRPKLYEYLDDEVGEMFINMPDEDFKAYKKAANTGYNVDDTFGSDALMSLIGGEEPYYKELGEMFQPSNVEDYKTKNANMTFIVHGEESSFSKVTFSFGGNSGSGYAKLGYNIKIRNNKKDLYGYTQFRVRGEPIDPSMIRNKLATDIVNRAGIPSANAGYVRLHINNEFMGLYTIHDNIKPSWIERKYNETDTTHLYKCSHVNNFLNYERGLDDCKNQNDEVTDNSEWTDLLKTLDAANTREEIEKVFDTDLFIKNMAIEWLFGRWDGLSLFGHNYYMYKNPETGKWIFIPYDFDNDLGSDLIGGMFYNINCFAYVYDWPLLTYKEFAGPGPKHILDILIHNDETSFIEHVKSIVRDVFNPTVLFEHIDEIKKLIGPYVLEDKTEDPVTGIRPGRINKSGKIDNEYMLYVVNSEFTTISTEFQTTMGLKRWILDKFRHACKIYDLDCSFAKEYLEGGSFTYEINQEYENPGLNPSDMVPPQPEPTETEAPTTETQTPVESCWSDVLGYPCCESTCVAIEEDDDGSWSWENNHWCGINSEKCQQDIKKCWSLAHGYPCCQKSTTVYEKDENGSWGYEDHHWCGIIPSN